MRRAGEHHRVILAPVLLTSDHGVKGGAGLHGPLKGGGAGRRVCTQSMEMGLTQDGVRKR